MAFVVAIDGVSGAGKGTLAKRLSELYHCSYLPTGNIYRVVAKKYLGHSASTEPEERKLLEIARNIDIKDIYDPNLRSDSIANLASIIAKNPKVREILNDFQRNWCQNQKIAIIEGRDIGTTICPNADVKFYLIADIKTRASRRYQELKTIYDSADEKTIEKELSERDFRDSHREYSPATQPKDAHIIDTSDLNIEEMLEKTVKIIENKLTRD